jgi:uncharacterized protein
MNPIYSFTIPVFTKTLTALDGLLVKAQAFVAEGNITEEALLNDRIAPDMFPFVKQVQIACDNAKGVATRLSGKEVPSHPDTEATLADLRERIKKTLEIVQATTEDSFAGAADVKVVLPYFPGKYLNGFDYAREYAVPNFFFHVVTAYALLRKNGLPIGKADYTGGLPFNEVEV